MTKFLVPALAAGLALAATTPALAKEVTITVSLDNVDLTDPADLERAHAKIESAVTRACRGQMGYLNNLREHREARDSCREEGLAKAMAQLERRTDMARAEARDSLS